MKKIILCVMAISMISITGLSAQEFSWGVKAGMNVSTVTNQSGTSKYDITPRVGYAAGLMGEYKFSDSFSIGADLTFSAQGDIMTYEKGYTQPLDQGTVDPEMSYWSKERIKQDLSYINIPILFNYYINDGKWALKTGVQLAFLVAAKTQTLIDISHSLSSSSALTDPYRASTSESVSKSKDEYEIFDVAIPIGVSYDITDAIVVDARCNFGVSKMRNHVFQLTAGYKF